MQFSGDVLPQVIAIEVYHDNSLVFGYEFFYQNNVQVGHHIGVHIHQEVRCERFNLEQGEYIVQMGGRLGDICDQISFTTSKGRTLAAGGQGGQPVTVSTAGATKPYIVAMGAGMGGHIHHFKCQYIDLAAHPALE